jgi:dTDP-6-deoxy-L-talose 4-dehydrogenase (NAD+)
LAKLKFERVIHLAWQGLPSLEPENNRSNFNISRDFIKILIDSGVQEVNVSGSCLEYGDLENLVDENTAGRNISDFGQTKLELLDYLATQEVPYRWFRIFYAYGPFQHKNSLLMEAYRSAKLGSPFFPNEPGVCKDFIFVDDVARAISRLLQTKDAFGVFNVGSGNSTSIGALVNTLNQEMRIPIQHFNPNPDGLKANCKKIEEANIVG